MGHDWIALRGVDMFLQGSGVVDGLEALGVASGDVGFDALFSACSRISRQTMYPERECTSSSIKPLIR